MSGAGRLRLALAVLIVAATAVVGAPGSGAAPPGGVTVSDSDFAPASIKVHPDEPVVFTIIQNAQYSHTITSDDDSFREQKIDWNHPKVNLPLKKPGRYAYYCRYDGGKGGQGMSGVILVAADQTTTATQPATTSTTAAPSTTTTVASTTTTTEPAPIHALEAPPPAPAPEPATTTTKAPKPTPDRAPTTTTTKPKVKAAAAAASATDLPTTTTIPGPELPSLSSLLAPDAPADAGTPDTTPSTAGRETPDDLALRLPDGEGKPADDGTGLLIALAVVLIAVVAAGAGYAWHHRPSRYFAA